MCLYNSKGYLTFAYARHMQPDILLQLDNLSDAVEPFAQYVQTGRVDDSC